MTQPAQTKSFLSLQRDALVAELGRLGQPAFRAKQIRQWIYRRHAPGYDAMTDLPGPLRKTLEGSLPLYSSRIEQTQDDPDGTRKILVRLAPGDSVEAVLIPAPDRMTACLSTQVGCPIACIFCASGKAGLQRNLEAHEIVEQLLHLDRLVPRTDDDDRRIDHIVVMGMGEPLLNLANLMRALESIQAPDGYGLGARRITVSTSGLPDRIRALANMGYAFNLAVSLHAPDDALRSKLVPVNRGIGDILDAAREYVTKTGREVTIEYVLIRRINDRPDQARKLAWALKDLRCNINLIPYNSIDEPGLEPPSDSDCEAFAAVLRREGFPVHVRHQRGDRIAAACGQLRAATEAGKFAR
ncbi:MAG: 23S rRNA (adenine(2503)-C(2))-methyltransferase RlmN [Planctomycetes bacterium]|nr:23S rRNA (adenine(2503)-C(2))-methyltransferase RlmN [Planctomycetota bacterium]MBI3846880.1 23S rRNA (adenine(2503)-C(2))-methyltransferase RlmN [Planctomycetota bacterium]